MISVVIPCHNAEATVAETLRSALGQEVEKEIIVIDDGSTDRSAEVLAGFGAAIRVVSTPNRGASAARQSGAERASGAYIQYLDGDDLLADGTLARRLEALTASGADVAHTDWRRLEPDGAGGFAPGEIRRPDVAAIERDAEAVAATSEFWAPPAALLYRRGIVEAIGPWPANLPVIQDARYLFEAARHGARFVHAPGIGAYYRVSPGSLSQRNRARFIRDCAVNAAEIEAVWRARPALSAIRQAALANIWAGVANAALLEGLDDFEAARLGYNRAAHRRATFEIGRAARRMMGARGAGALFRLAQRANRSVGRPLRGAEREPNPDVGLGARAGSCPAAVNVARPEPRILFLQVTDPANYPPTIHASQLMADAGWGVTLLSAPVAGTALSMPAHPMIELRAIRERASQVVGGGDFARYVAAATALAARLRPSVVYASDPLAAGPGLAAASVCGARLVYHEHDSPRPGAPRPWLRRLRRAAARKAELVVLPNEDRAGLAGVDLGVAEKVMTVWNLPCRRELPALACPAGDRLELYYHGSITPDRLPETIVRAVTRLDGRARLRIVGYEAPGAKGYIDRLLSSSAGVDGRPLAEYLGEIPRDDLLAQAARSQVGLAFMPSDTDDPNMRHMVGASNKAFDYMAAGQALLVSDLADWRAAFVEPGFGLACDPNDPDSVAQAFGWLIDHPQECRAMGRRGRLRIEQDWNYDAAFAPVLGRLAAARGSADAAPKR
jgi:glycosyltransferase involved in cell wall biosynthesis